MEIGKTEIINNSLNLTELPISNTVKNNTQVNIWDKPSIKYTSNPYNIDLNSVCYEMGTYTNMTSAISAEQANEPDEIKKITERYNIQVNDLIERVRNNEITQDEFINQLFDATKNSLKEKIKLTLPTETENLSDEQKCAIKNLFKTEGGIIRKVVITEGITGLNKDEKIAFLKKLQENYGKLMNEGLKELPNLNNESKEFYMQAFEHMKIPIDIALMEYQGLLTTEEPSEPDTKPESESSTEQSSEPQKITLFQKIKNWLKSLFNKK
ncbi:MAG: hypothetical protein MJ180_00720 [Candidatus Gastranaerophilales bacterium]|nr:hypothetical protein [Candidatus Gastranaerophilales bacterium]